MIILSVGRAADPRVRETIGANLRRIALKKTGGVVGDAAKLVDMPQGQFSGYSRGLRGFAIETLIRLAAILECSLDDLVRGVDPVYTAAAFKRRYPSLPADLAPVVAELADMNVEDRAPMLGLIQQWLDPAGARRSGPATAPTAEMSPEVSTTRRAARRR